jgi:hypothetical protein
MRDNIQERQDLEPLAKSAMSSNFTYLKVEISPKLQSKSKCHSFTKCVIFHVQIAPLGISYWIKLKIVNI